jgi:hypothetical protein
MEVGTKTQLFITNNRFGGTMPCRVCGADNLRKFDAELTASTTTIQQIKDPPVYVCRELLVCLDCGFAELRIPPTELRLLKKNKQEPGS